MGNNKPSSLTLLLGNMPESTIKGVTAEYLENCGRIVQCQKTMPDRFTGM